MPKGKYRKTPEHRKKLSEAIIKKYQEDSSYRERVSKGTKEAMRRILNDPIKREEYLEAQRRAHTPEVCRRQGETLRKTIETSNLREQWSKSHKALFKNPEYRKHYDEGREKMKRNPKWRENLSKSHKGKKPNWEKTHNYKILEEWRKLEKQGLKTIPILLWEKGFPIPDAIAIDFNNKKVYAIEVETREDFDRMKYSKWGGLYDDILWIIWRDIK